MNKYLLDTHILIWFCDVDDCLDNNIREDIEYFHNIYYVSVETLREIVILQSRKKISFDLKHGKIVDLLNRHRIEILPITVGDIKELEKLPTSKHDGRLHEDPFDRMLIAQAIANKFTLISADKKFPYYRDFGLKLLVNDL